MCLNKQLMKGKTNKRKIKKILIVLKINRFGKFGNSMPCQKCIQNIYKNTIKTGIYIHKIYYSTGNGNEIICKKFIDILNEPNKHQSIYGRHRYKLHKNKPK